ncbi:MAG: winged helix-turn-helix domain-containing protein [Bryobacteraceae bacterium]
MQNRSRAIGKEELLSNVWEDVAVTDNALARVVAQLRKALGDDAKIARYIETVPTIGYRFVAEVVELPPSVPSGTSTAEPAAAPRPESLPRDSFRAPPTGLSRALRDVLTSAAIWLRARSARPPCWSGTVLGGSIVACLPPPHFP